MMVKADYRLLLILLSLLMGLLFVGGPGHYSSRLYREAWDLGHVVLFGVLTIALFRIPAVERMPKGRQLVLIFIAVSVMAVLTELLQASAGRTPEWIDLRRDASGALLATVLVIIHRKWCLESCTALIIAACALFLYEVSPLVQTVVDDIEIAVSAPVLSDMESSFEVGRWRGNSDFRISDETVSEGESALRVTFNTDAYSGITLKYMFRDWRAYRYLHYSIYHDSTEPLELNLRINDFIHIENNRYDDRYNEVIVLRQGWNHFRVSVDDIRMASKDRETRIDNMQSIGWFVMNRPAPVTVSIDNVYLSE